MSIQETHYWVASYNSYSYSKCAKKNYSFTVGPHYNEHYTGPGGVQYTKVFGILKCWYTVVADNYDGVIRGLHERSNCM